VQFFSAVVGGHGIAEGFVEALIEAIVLAPTTQHFEV